MGSHYNRLTFRETDEAGNDTATYVYSQQNTGLTEQTAPSTSRIDAIDSTSPPLWSGKSLIAVLSDVFLPSGYPQSVTDDYLRYQVFDSLQAFCSSIAGLLSSRAVLQGVGVGNANASPTSALLLHILQDSSGRIATILFAHRVSTALEPECKRYRLAADVFNDVAMVLDCGSPMVPAGVMRVTILSAAGILRALCGVAGGSSKASLSAHFARWGNLAELNAKDSSQETVISLLGMLVGSIVVSQITGFKSTWTALLILLCCHLGLNYAAVRAVQMTSLNRQRANILFSSMLSSDPDLDLERLGRDDLSEKKRPSTPFKGTVLTPAEVSTREQIFPRDGALAWTSWSASKDSIEHVGTAEIGVSLSTFFAGARRRTSSRIPVPTLARVFQDEFYMLSLTPMSRMERTADRGGKWHASIILKRGCPVDAQLKAWVHALLAARVLCEPAVEAGSQVVTELEKSAVCMAVTRTLAFLNADARFERYVEACVGAGWDVGIAALETRGGRRVELE